MHPLKSANFFLWSLPPLSTLKPELPGHTAKQMEYLGMHHLERTYSLSCSLYLGFVYILHLVSLQPSNCRSYNGSKTRGTLVVAGAELFCNWKPNK